MTVALRTRPAGGLIGAEALFPLGSGFAAGAYLDYFFYWADMGAKIEWTLWEGFLIASLRAGVEPGEFFPVGSEEREPGLRSVLRARAEINYRIGPLWLYDRLTVEGRLRTFEERDPYRDAILGSELSVEEAFAPLIAVYRWGSRSAIWLYAEITVAAEARFGLLDLRPSAGMIVEELFDGFTFDLDAYWGLRKNSDLEGCGLLILGWWRF